MRVDEVLFAYLPHQPVWLGPRPTGGVPILLSSGFGMRGGEVSVVSDHGVEDVGLAAGEADEWGGLCCFDGSPSCGRLKR